MSVAVDASSQDDRVATRADAPFPNEHTESNGFHQIWIPPTTPTDHLCVSEALNLRHEALGTGGDWHACWEVPISGVPWHVHQCPTSATFLELANGNRRLNDLIGIDGVADARPALHEIGHPAGSRSEPVWCATHSRAVIEMGWQQIWPPDTPPTHITTDPRNIAIWLSDIEEWEQLHNFATTIGHSLKALQAAHDTWTAWTEHLTPRALSGWPPPRWQGLEAERAWIEKENAKWSADLQAALRAAT